MSYRCVLGISSESPIAFNTELPSYDGAFDIYMADFVNENTDFRPAFELVSDAVYFSY